MEEDLEQTEKETKKVIRSDLWSVEIREMNGGIDHNVWVIVIACKSLRR